MAHFAEIDENNVVKQVIVVHNNELLDNGVESEAKGIAFCQSLFGGNWVQTSYNTYGNVHYAPSPPAAPGTPDGGIALRGNYAGIGSTYDIPNDVFYAPQPFPSWTLNEDTCLWDSPVAYPEDGERYQWDEETTSWVLINV